MIYTHTHHMSPISISILLRLVFYVNFQLTVFVSICCCGYASNLDNYIMNAFELSFLVHALTCVTSW